MRWIAFSILTFFAIMGGAFAQSAVSISDANTRRVFSSALVPVKSTSLENGHVLKTGAGALISINVAIGATAGWVAILDAAAVPSNGAVAPIWCQAVTSNGTVGSLNWSWGLTPVSFATGATVLFGTGGCLTFTGSATAFFSAQIL